MKKQCTFFKYYFEPYTHDKKGKAKYHTYRKKDIIRWTEKYSDDILRPVFDWSGIEVINYILDNKMNPNALYYEGFKRVGCFPCIMSGHKEVYEIIKRYPSQFETILKEEKRIGSSFFKIDFVPHYAKSGICQRTGKKYATGEDVKKYLENKNKTMSLFEDEPISCSSYYHLCE